MKNSTGDILIHVSFGWLFVGAALFFEERLVADSAFYLAKVINREAFHVEHQRYILALSQALPLLFVKLHLPMKAVLIADSVGHVVFFYSLFLVCRYVFHERIAGWWLLLCQTAGLFHGFFVPMFEVYYAAGLVVLIYSMRSSRHPVAMFTSIACMFFVMTSHFAGILLLLWLLAILIVERKLQRYQVFSFAAVLLYIGIMKTFFISEYESGKMSAAIEVFNTSSYGIQYLLEALKFLVKFYPDVVVLSSILFVYTAFTDRTRLMVFLVFFAMIFAFIHLQQYGFERSRYQEQIYFPLAFIASGSFLLFLDRKDTVLKVSMLAVAVIIFATRFSLIWLETSRFEKRTAYFKKCISACRQLNASKCVLDDTLYPADVHDPNWSFPIETMFFSAYGSPENTVTVCLRSELSDESVRLKIDSTHYLFRRQEVMPQSDLNPHYFRLKPELYQQVRP